MTILIKSPILPRDFIASLPILQTIINNNHQQNIAYLIQEDQQDLFDFLPSGLSMHVLPKEKDSFLGVHRFSVNESALFNIQTYMDLRGDLSSSYLGYCFKAKKRVGAAKGLNRFFYTHPIIEKEMIGFDQKMDLILKKVFDEPVEIQSIQPTQKISNIVNLFERDVPEDYLLVVIDLSQEQADEWWVSFLNGFENQKFIIVETSEHPQLDRFYKKLDQKNSYLFDKNPDSKRLFQLATRTKGVLSNQQTLAWMLAKEGIDVLCFTREESYKIAKIQFVPIVCSIENETLIDLIQKTHHELKL